MCSISGASYTSSTLVGHTSSEEVSQCTEEQLPALLSVRDASSSFFHSTQAYLSMDHIRAVQDCVKPFPADW